MTDDEGLPLLDRPPSIVYDCEVARPTSLLGASPWRNGGLFPEGDGAFLAWLQAEAGETLGGMTRVLVSSLDAAGTLAEPTLVSDVAPGRVGGLVVAPQDDRFTLVWAVDGNPEAVQVMSTQLSAAGEVLSAPSALLASVGGPSALVARGGEHALIGVERVDGVSAIRFQRLDGEGRASGPARVIVESAEVFASLAITPHPRGYICAYAAIDPQNGQPRLTSVLLDADGAPLAEPLVLWSGEEGTFARSESAFLPREEDVLVAWTEFEGRYDEQNVASSIRLAVIDGSGNLGPMHRLQRPYADLENVSPHLFAFGDDFGLLWSKGSVTYLCAGCFPNDTLRFALFDGADFTRLSNEVELLSPTQFGLLDARAAVVGRDVIVTADSTHHVYAEGAAATIRCTP